MNLRMPLTIVLFVAFPFVIVVADHGRSKHSKSKGIIERP
jgi:hypothetical protein